MGVHVRTRNRGGHRRRGRQTDRNTAARIVVSRRASEPRFRPENGRPMPDNTVMPIVRVAVLAAGDGPDGAGRLTEMALPAELPLREIIPAVQRTVLPSTDAPEGAPARLSLAPIGGAPFSL